MSDSSDALQVVTAELAGESRSGIYALAAMSDEAFDQRVELFKKARERTQALQKSLMREGTHYGTVPGTSKPTLMKPGSEVLLQPLGLVPRFEHEITHGDGVTAPPITVITHCYLHQGSHSGPVVGEGAGAASSWEKKYRYRDAERSCPDCALAGAIIKGKAEYGGGWLCWARRGGCGAKFGDGDDRIEKQVAGKVENPDPYELLNTLVKMSAKRAQVDAALRVTATSDLFTQDLEDQDPPTPTERTEPADERAEPPRNAKAKRSPPRDAGSHPPISIEDWDKSWGSIRKILDGLTDAQRQDVINSEGADALVSKARRWDRDTIRALLEMHLDILSIADLPRQPKGWNVGRLVLALLEAHGPEVLEDEPPEGEAAA